MGLDPAKPLVCVINRDPMYLRVMAPAQDYSYHSFRDSNIDNYRDAAIALIERGYQVIRMGRHVDAQMKLHGGGFFDYAISDFRSDFMDVYLGAKCSFTISNGTGFDAIPMVFRRPICFVNEAPFEYLSTWMAGSLAIWKHHMRDGRRMQPSEIAASGAGLFSRSEQYNEAGITLIENTPEEIRDVALEMVFRLGGKVDDSIPTPRQDAFWLSFPRSKSPHTGQPLHGEIRLRIGSKFLATYAI
jgi:putative glycosyltransferase (TIGR04372 family)